MTVDCCFHLTSTEVGDLDSLHQLPVQGLAVAPSHPHCVQYTISSLAWWSVLLGRHKIFSI